MATKKVIDAGKTQKAKREADQATYSAANKTRLEATAKQKAAADAVRNERLANPKSVESRMAKAQAESRLANPSLAALNDRMRGSGLANPFGNRYDPSSGKNIVNVNRKKPMTPAEQAYMAQRKETQGVLRKTPENQTYRQRPTTGATPAPAPKPAMGMKKGGLPGLDKLRKFEANPANKAEVAKRSEMASKMFAGMKDRQSANSDKVQAMKAQADAAKARATAKQSAITGMKAAPKSTMADRMKAAPKPALKPARTTGGMSGLGAAVRSGAPALKFGTSGGMGSMAGRGGMGGSARPMARPAMTPQVKQGLQGMSDKLRGMPTPMKKGGKAGKK